MIDRIFRSGILVLLSMCIWQGSASATDYRSYPRVKYASNCYSVLKCGTSGCFSRKVCRRGCPTGAYTCSSLYAGYGPYGGPAYWTGYGW